MSSLLVALAELLSLFYAPHAGGVPPGIVVAPDAIQPQLAIDSKGNIYVVYIRQGNIAVSVSRDRGKSFGGPVVAIDVQGRAQGGMQRGPRIGVDAQGIITVTAPVVFDDAEYKKQYPTAEIYLVTSRDGGKSWTTPLQINEVAKKAPESLHWMAVAANGDVHVAWLDIRNRQRGQDIYYSRVAGGKVGTNIHIASEVCECCAPGLAVDGQGNPFVAYREGGDKRSREIYATSSDDRGASFRDAAQVNQMPTKEDS